GGGAAAERDRSEAASRGVLAFFARSSCKTVASCPRETCHSYSWTLAVPSVRVGAMSRRAPGYPGPSVAVHVGRDSQSGTSLLDPGADRFAETLAYGLAHMLANSIAGSRVALRAYRRPALARRTESDAHVRGIALPPRLSWLP